MHHMLLCDVSGIELAENLGRGDRIIDDLFITNDKHTIGNLLSNWSSEALGEMLESEILTSSAIIYSRSDVVTDTNRDSVYEEHIAQLATDIDFFLATLWFIKDHCCSIGFIIILRDGKDAFIRMVHKGGRFLADGTISQTRFTRAELKAARTIFWSFAEPGRQYCSAATTLDKRGSNRFTRALSHRNAANYTNDVAFKIASYCSALEALFLTDKVELTHQLAERVAFFLEDNPVERRKVFSKLKDAYSFRSSSVHGSGIKCDDNKLKELSTACDNILRRVLTQILRDKDLHPIFSDEKMLNEFFLDRIIGPHS